MREREIIRYGAALMLALWLTSLGGARAEDTAAAPALLTARQLYDAMATANYAWLDQQLNQVQAGYENGRLDEWDMEKVFGAFLENGNPTLQVRFEEWIKAYPSSYAAHAAYGLYLWRLGFDHRGEAWEQETPTKRLEAARAIQDESKAELDRSLTLTHRPLASYSVLIEWEGVYERASQRGALLKTALALDPKALGPRLSYLYYLQPKWGGSLDAMERFANEQSVTLEPDEADALRAIILTARADVLEWSGGRFTPKQILRELDAALRLCPPRYAARILKEHARLLNRLNRYNEALAEFDKLLDTTPTRRAYRQRGFARLETQRIQDGLSDYEIAADRGDAWSQNQLGYIYSTGQYGVPKDPQRALAWYRRAADLGEPEALYAVGDMFRTGELGSPDYAQARAWYERAAAEGSLVAFTNLGSMHWNGYFPDSSHWKALHYWSVPALKGEPEANRNLDHLLPLPARWLVLLYGVIILPFAMQVGSGSPVLLWARSVFVVGALILVFYLLGLGVVWLRRRGDQRPASTLELGTTMRRLSSRSTFFYKRVFPLLWVGILLVFVATAGWGMTTQGQFHPEFIAIPVVMAVLGLFAMKRLVFSLVDEVWDAGDHLIIKNQRDEARIPLSDIINVSESSFTNPPRITLTLRQPCQFGNEITFSPPGRFFPFSKSTIAGELIQRIDAKRRG